MIKIDYTQFLAIVYADIFDYPLTLNEAKKWAISGRGEKQEVEAQGGFLFLKGREKIVMQRKERDKFSKKKLVKLMNVIEAIKEIDSIEAVFVTGSVAVLNAKEDADIDVMIITSPRTIWRTRIKLLSKLRTLGVLRYRDHVEDRICVNIFLDVNHLEITNRNLYTAHEIMQAKCLFDRGGVEDRWLGENRWVKEFLPNALRIKNKSFRTKAKGRTSIVEWIAFWAQYLYMKPKMTNEKVGWGFSFFHPVDGAKYVNIRYKERLKRLGIIKGNENF